MTAKTTPPTDRAFGQHIRSCRRARGLTQEALADRCGLSADTIRRLEHGSFSPSLTTLRKICAGFDIPLSVLFEGYELGEATRVRELAERFGFLTAEEQAALLDLLVTLCGRLDGA